MKRFFAVLAAFALSAGAAVAQLPVKNPPPLPLTLRDYLRMSSLAVVGKVIKIDRMDPEKMIVSEHDPKYYIATVRVSKTLKGDPRTDVFVVFANSMDRLWHKSPKLTVGQKGIFILQNFVPVRPVKIRAGIFFSVSDPLQVQPNTESNLKKIKRLLRTK